MLTLRDNMNYFASRGKTRGGGAYTTALAGNFACVGGEYGAW